MRLFLHLTIGDWKLSGYERPLLNYASSLADDIVGSDLDSASDAVMAELTLKLAAEASSIFLMVQSNETNASMGTVLTVVNTLLSSPEKISCCVLSGEHVIASKLLRAALPVFVQEDDDKAIRKLIGDFANG